MSINRRHKQIWRVSISAILAIVVLLAGVPIFPGMGVKTALANTVGMSVSPQPINSVYEPDTTIEWSYQDMGHSTKIDLCGDGEIASGTYGQGKNRVSWNGQLNGRPIVDGDYKVCVTPTDKYAPYQQYVNIKVVNSPPMRPKAVQVVPDVDSETHIIRGMGEIGSKVTIRMTTTKRDGYDQVPGGEVVLAKDVPVKPQRIWSRDVPIIDKDFTNFPSTPLRDPIDFVGEWEVRVKLPVYEIAHIQVTAERTIGSDTKKSTPSEMLNVLRYQAPAWNVTWEALAGYYKKADSKESLVKSVNEIAGFNDVDIRTCNDKEGCPDSIEKGMNILIINPELAGNILESDLDELTFEKIANRKAHPMSI